MTNPPEQQDRARQREAILRFWAAMTTTPYDEVLNEYLGKPLNSDTRILVNRLYQATEMAIHWMNEEQTNV